ncbi:amidase [Falsirhodobacter sp. 20TX0035]|uniref:amidase n=1 Tax=Falsirhodobacter sp. 20TX0035 TaxID=3022019 RepID=UPI0023305A9C|nr:amidase family protein [Falsirhodobacter sp. 20TX0035]MDB6452545.1 amidase family protein [Falsirhodobacter sp. 20TX0035]
MEWLGRSAADLGRGIHEGRINAVELVEAFLDTAAAHPDGDRIYARLTPERARDEALAAATRAKDGRRRGPLDGVPVSWKDLFDTAGIATEAGSALLAGRVPDRDACVLSTATAGGLICLGKTHMSELAFSGLGLNPVTATAPNVNDPDAVAGGSSSGAAASVAFGLAAAAIGSDTGGSVRTPAAWNDLVGLKTTHGRLSNKGVVPLCDTLDTVGPLARTTEDCTLLLAALEGRRPGDMTGMTLSGVRLAVLDTMGMEDLEDAPARAFDTACQRLAEAGAHVTRLSFEPIREAMGFSGALFTAEGYAIWRDRIEAAPERMFPPILERFRAGRDVAAADYIDHVRRLKRIQAEWRAVTAPFDAVILPTSAILPPHAARLMEDAAYYARMNLLALRNTRIGNLLGLCALSLPTDTPSCGIMLMCPPMQEERLLRLGMAAERAVR